MKIKQEKARLKRKTFLIDDYGLKVTYDPVAWVEAKLEKFIVTKLEEGESIEECFAIEIDKGMLRIEKEEL